MKDLNRINALVWNGNIRQQLEKSSALTSDDVDWIMTAIKQRLNRRLKKML